jgi:hypothetical protein
MEINYDYPQATSPLVLKKTDGDNLSIYVTAFG